MARKDGQPRFCVDYRGTINMNLIRETWPMANLEDNIDMARGAQFISVADVQSAYWQIPIHPGPCPDYSVCHHQREILLQPYAVWCV